MKMLLAVLIGAIVLTFSWGWYKNVYQGNLTTSMYTHRYTQDVEIFFDENIQKVKDSFHYVSKVQLPRAKLKKVTD